MPETPNTAVETAPGEGRVAVVIPLSVSTQAMRQSLVSLAAQTRPPDLVLLLDDGRNPEARNIADAAQKLPVSLIEVGEVPLPTAIQTALVHLADYEFTGFLLPGDRYAPERLERCIAALGEAQGTRLPSVAISRILPVDGRGQPLPPEDPRAAHTARLWAGSSGGLPEWLGTGNFVGPESNILARRSFLLEFTPPETAEGFAYGVAVLAGVQGLLAVVDEPLLLHSPPPPEMEQSVRNTPDSLALQLSVLLALRDRLPISPETRRSFSAFHRSAWNNLSGQREDLFQQVILRLAAESEPATMQAAADEVLRSHEAQTVPAHLQDLMASGNPLDIAAYARALREAHAELASLREDNHRLARIAGSVQDSGWIRLGAWLGERSSRRMMEMDTPENGSAPAKEPQG